MEFGCSTLLYGGYDLDTAIAGLKEAGYAAVELSAIPGMGEHLKVDAAAGVYEDIKGQLAAAGLALESVACSGVLGTARLAPLMHAAETLGAPCLTLSADGMADDEEAWEETVAAVRAALPLCEETGVKLSVMPHVRASVYNTATATRFMEEIASPCVGLNVDNTHLQRVGDDPIAAVGALRDWILTARIRDYRSDDLAIGPIESQIPGKGIADVRGYYAACCEVPGLKYIVVEMVGSKDLELREVQRIVGEAITVLKSYQE